MEEFLSSIGITDVKEIVYNPSYDQLYEDELQPGKRICSRVLSELGAVNVLTGEYTGRSPKDKFIVKDDSQRKHYGGTAMAPKTTTSQLMARSGPNKTRRQTTQR